MTPPMPEWTAPEGMVPCEPGPVLRTRGGAAFRVVGHIERTRDTRTVAGRPITLRWREFVYRPCDEKGEWV